MDHENYRLCHAIQKKKKSVFDSEKNAQDI